MNELCIQDFLGVLSRAFASEFRNKIKRYFYDTTSLDIKLS